MTRPASRAASGRCPLMPARASARRARSRPHLCSAHRRCRCSLRRRGAMWAARQANAGTPLRSEPRVAVHGVKEGGRPWGARHPCPSHRSSRPSSSAEVGASCLRAAQAPRLSRKTTRARRSKVMSWSIVMDLMRGKLWAGSAHRGLVKSYSACSSWCTLALLLTLDLRFLSLATLRYPVVVLYYPQCVSA